MEAQLDNDLVDIYELKETEIYDDFTTHTVVKPGRVKGEKDITAVEQWHRLKELGHGYFGTAWLEQEQGGELRAVKIIRKQISGQKTSHYLRELIALASCTRNEANFVGFKGWFQDDDRIYIAMPYYEQGDLDACVKSTLPEHEARLIGAQVARALRFMHDQHLTHRDIKPSNILVVSKAPNWWVKVADFGVAKRVLPNGTGLYTALIGDFVAPEVFNLVDDDSDDEYEEEYPNAADLWSLGCLVYWLLTHTTPFPFSDLKLLKRYCHRKIGFPIEHLTSVSASVGVITLVKGLMAVNPRDRLNAKQALESSWLQQVFHKRTLTSLPRSVPLRSPGNLGAHLQARPSSIDPSTIQKDLAATRLVDSYRPHSNQRPLPDGDQSRQSPLASNTRHPDAPTQLPRQHNYVDSGSPPEHSNIANPRSTTVPQFGQMPPLRTLQTPVNLSYGDRPEDRAMYARSPNLPLDNQAYRNRHSPIPYDLGHYVTPTKSKIYSYPYSSQPTVQSSPTGPNTSMKDSGSFAPSQGAHPIPPAPFNPSTYRSARQYDVHDARVWATSGPPMFRKAPELIDEHPGLPQSGSDKSIAKRESVDDSLPMPSLVSDEVNTAELGAEIPPEEDEFDDRLWDYMIRSAEKMKAQREAEESVLPVERLRIAKTKAEEAEEAKVKQKEAWENARLEGRLSETGRVAKEADHARWKQTKMAYNVGGAEVEHRDDDDRMKQEAKEPASDLTQSNNERLSRDQTHAQLIDQQIKMWMRERAQRALLSTDAPEQKPKEAPLGEKTSDSVLPAPKQTERAVLDAFQSFASAERAKLTSQRQTQAQADKELKLRDLVEFSKHFKLKTPVPKDLIPILSNDTVKQQELANREVEMAGPGTQSRDPDQETATLELVSTASTETKNPGVMDNKGLRPPSSQTPASVGLYSISNEAWRAHKWLPVKGEELPHLQTEQKRLSRNQRKKRNAQARKVQVPGSAM